MAQIMQDRRRNFSGEAGCRSNSMLPEQWERAVARAHAPNSTTSCTPRQDGPYQRPKRLTDWWPSGCWPGSWYGVWPCHNYNEKAGGSYQSIIALNEIMRPMVVLKLPWPSGGGPAVDEPGRNERLKQTTRRGDLSGIGTANWRGRRSRHWRQRAAGRTPHPWHARRRPRRRPH